MCYSSAYNQDLTGWKILSTGPISVISGHSNVHYSQAVTYCSQAIGSTVIPASALGTTYVVPGIFGGTTSTCSIRILAVENQTRILYEQQPYVEKNEGEFIVFSRAVLSAPSQVYCTKRCVVALFCPQTVGAASRPVIGTFQLPIVPEHSFSNSLLFSSAIQEQAMTHFLSVVLQRNADDTQKITLDGSSLGNSSSWQSLDVRGTSYMFTSKIISAGVHSLLSSDSNTLFTAYLYGHYEYSASVFGMSYGYPVGYGGLSAGVDSTTLSSSSSTTTTPTTTTTTTGPTTTTTPLPTSTMITDPIASTITTSATTTTPSPATTTGQTTAITTQTTTTATAQTTMMITTPTTTTTSTSTTTNPTGSTTSPPQDENGSPHYTITLRGDFTSDTGVDFTLDCTDNYIQEMKDSATRMLQKVNGLLGVTLCVDQAQGYLLEIVTTAISTNRTEGNVKLDFHSTYSNSLSFDQVLACGNEISAYLQQHQNWYDPILPGKPGCPTPVFYEEVFQDGGKTWTCSYLIDLPEESKSQEGKQQQSVATIPGYELELFGNFTTETGVGLTPECVEVYATEMSVKANDMLQFVNSRLGLDFCTGQGNGIYVLSTLTSFLGNEASPYGTTRAYFIKTSSDASLTFNDLTSCAKEVEAFLRDQANWGTPLLPERPPCPLLIFTAGTFYPENPSWICFN